jgi:glucose/arabinose dehydrogenase
VSGGSEQGLLGLAFSKAGNIADINFTDEDDASVTRAYRFDASTHTFGAHKDLWVVPKPTEMHNGGNVAFGPDGYLYVSLGDGGQSGDPKGNAQSLGTFLGKILRVDVNTDLTYDIPASNPFKGDSAAKDEIWDYGFRNPWRFSFDAKTGDLWISDVGRDHREEIDFEPASSDGGHNYGWNRMEGSIPYEGSTAPPGHVPPVYDYEHSASRCVVIGGFVYRGDAIADLEGAFLFTDYCAGGIEAIRLRDGKVDEHRHFKISGDHISSFGQGADGEVYALALVEGAIYRIDAR